MLARVELSWELAKILEQSLLKSCKDHGMERILTW